jgi:hypothetical protein
MWTVASQRRVGLSYRVATARLYLSRLMPHPTVALEAQGDRVRRPQRPARRLQVQLGQLLAGQEVGYVTRRNPRLPLSDLNRPSRTEGIQTNRHHPVPP